MIQLANDIQMIISVFTAATAIVLMVAAWYIVSSDK